MNIPDEAVQEAINAWFEETREHIKAVEPLPEQARRMRLALTAAAPYMSGVKVKQLGEDDYEVIIDAAAKAMRKATSGVRGQAMTVYDCLDWWVMKATENHILSALELSSTREQALEEIIALCKDYAEDSQPDSEYRLACNDIIEALQERCALSSQPAQTGDGDE